MREALQPGATPQGLLTAGDWPGSRHPVLIVGHQPELGQVAALLLRIEGGECAIRKAAAWWLRTRERDGQQQTVVWAVQSPETA